MAGGSGGDEVAEVAESAAHAVQHEVKGGEVAINDEIASVSDDSDAAILPKGQVDPVYEAKAIVLNRAIQEIGMGW
ncbi:hypothetical protein B0T14DRAFT_559783 [Immersiella caudata]|uniref:Uncharacterized protein n=1 Tax=Immersiella caudata TaxID=314043 RepID=A0AA40CC36_9PEZI|nr:hypothetical protein B0T14DRAFT_559783 [Immersiella caudata]